MAEIPEGNPYIDQSNWAQMIDKGWRFVMNFPIRTEATHDEIEETIEEYQVAYGASNVTIGNSYNEQALGPIGHDSDYGSGLYVRDVPQLVAALHRDLDNWTEFEGDLGA